MTRSRRGYRLFFLFLVFAGAIVLQTALFGHFSNGGVRPHLVLVVVISLGFLRGPVQGSAIGFAGGLLADLQTGVFIGLGALAAASAGFIAGWSGTRLVRDSLGVVFVLTLILTVWHELVYAFGVGIVRFRLPVPELFAVSLFRLAVSNGVAVLLIHRPLERLDRWVERRSLEPGRWRRFG